MGKYDFDGIKTKGAKAVELLLSVAFPPFAAVMRIPVVGSIIDFIIQFIVRWLANHGLIILNVGAYIAEGYFDQKAFDQALDDGIRKVLEAKGVLTPDEAEAIDAQVENAANKFLPYNRPK